MPIVLLDSGPLGLLTHPANDPEPLMCKSWAKQLVSGKIQIAIPQIVEYELRRELIRAKKAGGIKNLDIIKQVFPLVPLNEKVMEKAAQLWAWARDTGQQTAHDENIDIDVVLAAQAVAMASEEEDYVVIATSNVRHLARYTAALTWKEISTENCFNPRIPVPTRI